MRRPMARIAQWMAVDDVPTEAQRRFVLAYPRFWALSSLGIWDQELLEILLLKPDAIRAMIEVVRPEHLSSEACRRIFATSPRS